MAEMNTRTKDIFAVFLKIGTFAFGGVYSMLAFFERELVTRRKWITHEEFAESVVIGQLTPGAPIINTGLFIGYTLRKLKGALATVAGLVLPSFFVVLVIAYIYVNYKDLALIRSILKGIAPAVVGLIVAVVYNMSKDILKDSKSILLAVTVFFCLAVFKLNPIFLIIASAVAGLMFFRRGKPDGNN